MDTSKKFLYINNDSGDRDNSRCYPVSSFVGIEVVNSTSITLYFKDARDADTTDVSLSRTSGSNPKEIFEKIFNEINNSRSSVIVIADDFSQEYIHPDITGVGAVAGAATSRDISVGAVSAATLSGTALSVTATSSLNGDVNLGDAIADKVEINGKIVKGNVTQTDVDTQDHTLTAAEFLKGVVVHTSVTAAGSITFDTGANLCSTLELESNNEVATCLYINDGAFDVTLNGGTPTGVTYVNNPTIAAESAATLVVRRTAADTVSVYIV